MEITFYRKLANKVAQAVIDNSEYTEFQEKRIRYGLVCIFSDLYKFILLLIAFSLFSLTREFLIAAFGSLPLRMFLGGFHAKSEISCIFISFLTILVSILLGSISPIPQFIQIILIFLLPVIGIIIAPVRTQKIVEKKTVYKVVTGIITPSIIIIDHFLFTGQILSLTIIQNYILAIYQIIKNYTKFKIITNTQNL